MKKNRIVFNAYRGSQYSCNPKYISEYLMDHYPGRYEIIWAFNDPKQYLFLKKQGVKLVRYNSLKRFYYEATCKISINNVGSFSWFPIRTGQEHINTWHGGYSIKKVGISESANSPMMKKTIEMSSDLTTELLSTSKKYDQNTAMEDLGYKKKTFQCGYPRNDIIFRQRNGEIDLKNKISKFFNFHRDSYIVLYVPTFRYDRKKTLPHPAYQQIKTLLQQQGKSNPVILTRMHHLMMNNLGDQELTIDATNYPDMQELLAAADCIITDYSSCIWDYAILKKPIYLYTPDFSEYSEERGYHVNIDQLGFPVAKDNVELLRAFEKMTDDVAKKNAEEFIEKCESYESGTACEQVGKWIYRRCFTRSEKSREEAAIGKNKHE
jgi:CDP-glycerol glycerophosphotransferase